MPIISQTGTFVAGTSGFNIECDLTPLEAGKLTNVTQIELTLTRPTGTSVTRNLPLPGSIIDTQGKIQFSVAVGDLQVSGIYTIRLKITYASAAVLVLTGDFNVSD